MGGGQSTQAAAAQANGNGNGHHATNGSNGNSRRDVYANLERRDSEDEDCTCTGLLSFCNPAARRTNSNSKAKKTASDVLGTPILTPKLGDRRKQRAQGSAERRQPTLFMSRYGGLEKEPSADVDEIGNGDGEGGWKRAPSAVVHEGTVSQLCCAIIYIGKLALETRLELSADGQSFATTYLFLLTHLTFIYPHYITSSSANRTPRRSYTKSTKSARSWASVPLPPATAASTGSTASPTPARSSTRSTSSSDSRV